MTGRHERTPSDPAHPSGLPDGRDAFAGPDGFPVEAESTPSGRKLVLASAMMALLLLAPPAVGGAAFTALTHTAAHQRTIAVTPSGRASSGSATGAPQPSGSRRLAHHKPSPSPAATGGA